MLKYNIGEVLELSRDIRTREARWTVASTLRQRGTVNGIDETVICLAYLALIIKNTEAGNYEYPDLEFRLCSKCNGNYEYCQEHLFTNTHVK